MGTSPQLGNGVGNGVGNGLLTPPGSRFAAPTVTDSKRRLQNKCTWGGEVSDVSEVKIYFDRLKHDRLTTTSSGFILCLEAADKLQRPQSFIDCD